MSYLVLPSNHYASDWSQNCEIRDTETVTKLGVEYATCRNPKRKEDLLFEIVRFFHSYLFKYAGMIISGSLPKTGGHVNEDTKKMLRMFLPAGTRVTGFTLAKTARTLNLAFKGQSTEEVYNILVGCLVRAVDKYDPRYVEKVKLAVEAIEKMRNRCFTSKQVSEDAEFNCARICLMLVRRGHLKRVARPGNRKPAFFKRDDWPVPDRLLNGKPIDLQYFIPTYFRRYLQQYITDQMKSIEARNPMIQLEEMGRKRWDGTMLPSSEGNMIEPTGKRWMADTGLMERDHDLPELTLAWVSDCSDFIFRSLDRRERLFLYQHYAKEMTQTQIADSVGIGSDEYDRFHDEILGKCRKLALAKTA